MSVGLSTFSPFEEIIDLGTHFCLLGRISLSFFHNSDELSLFSSIAEIKHSIPYYLSRFCEHFIGFDILLFENYNILHNLFRYAWYKFC